MPTCRRFSRRRRSSRSLPRALGTASIEECAGVRGTATPGTSGPLNGGGGFKKRTPGASGFCPRLEKVPEVLPVFDRPGPGHRVHRTAEEPGGRTPDRRARRCGKCGLRRVTPSSPAAVRHHRGFPLPEIPGHNDYLQSFQVSPGIRYQPPFYNKGRGKPT
jgi:hypothetical protein